MAISIYPTPEIFLTKTNHTYPPNNDIVFEQYFYETYLKENKVNDRVYLPIQWTCFYISRNYGNNDMSDLQNFLDSLPRNIKYFTVVQWDDGILNNLSDLDILIFSSGGVGDYPIPLINRPHDLVIREKNIFASFIGVINGRHRIREKMQSALFNNKDYVILPSNGFENFKIIMERSIFSLCPRGYGKTSFRINESLNLGSIPVYIYDDPWIPFNDLINFKEYGVLINENEIDSIDQILKSYSEDDIKKLQERGKEVYKDYFSYSGCYEKINIIINKYD